MFVAILATSLEWLISQPICSQYTLFHPPENIYGFLMFSGAEKLCIGNESVNEKIIYLLFVIILCHFIK